MMGSELTGSFQLMKSMNRALILNTIRSEGPISRADIAKTTKLTPPTVTNIVGELLKTGLIKESDTGVSKGGRRPIMLTVNWPSRNVIGVDIGVNKIRVVLTDLNANILYKTVAKMPVPVTEEKLLETLKKSIHRLITQSGADKERLIGIGVGMHGMVDSEQGVSLYAPSWNLKNVAVKEELEGEFLLPVKAENDAKTLALGERWFGQGKDTENLVCINVGMGIGAGIILNNHIYRGNDHIAGEIGHMVIDVDGPKCSCGNYGCFQTLSGGSALRDYVLKEIALGRETILSDRIEKNPDSVDGKAIYECAKAGDALALEAFSKTGSFLGIGLLNLLHLINPPLVVIGGGVSRAGDLILEPVRKIIKLRGLTETVKATKIVESGLGENGTVIGAATLILADLFASNNS
jgi:glucokinase-like ROK family protein